MSVESEHRREARRLQKRVTAALEVEYRPGTPARDQLEQLANDITISVEHLLMAMLIIEKADAQVAHLQRAEPDDFAWEAA